jgi:hypothetical protein
MFDAYFHRAEDVCHRIEAILHPIEDVCHRIEAIRHPIEDVCHRVEVILHLGQSASIRCGLASKPYASEGFAYYLCSLTLEAFTIY